MTTPTTLVPGAAPVAALGGADRVLTEEEVRSFVAGQLAGVDLDGRSLCVLVPDGTRSCPLPLLLGAVHAAAAGRVSALTVLVALGTHAAMSEGALARHLGHPEGDSGGGLASVYPGTAVVQHAWWEPATFAHLGRISAERVGELSGGLLHEGVDVRLNRAVVEHDVVLVVGPVFPHEVVGFSGGTKYFFPGVAGQEVIDLSHWLGALITSAGIIGTRGTTPVRALIDEASALIASQTLALCVVVAAPGGVAGGAPSDSGVAGEGRAGTGEVPAAASPGLHAVSFGAPQAAWAAAADVSAVTHVRYLDAPVRRVLSIVPEKYEDVWTAAKGFYKLEPVVADGGEVVLYAPHIRTLSVTHPEIERVGYHCRDFFVAQWERYRHLPWGVLAHSTHLRGAGTYDPVTGERPRVRVVLATGIPEDVVRGAALEHLDPAAVDVEARRADPDTLVVPSAGEVLYRLR